MDKRIIHTELCVVGTGVAGLSAAIRARENGVKDIVVLEKMKRIGGCSPIFGMTLGINTPLHQRYGLHLDVNKIFMEHMKIQNWDCNAKLVSRWFHTVGDVFAWLESMGARFDELIDSGDYGDSAFKMQLLTSGSNVGAEINKALTRRMDELGITIYTQTSAKKLIRDEDGAVIGLVAECNGEEIEIQSKATLIAAGSICFNKEMIDKYVDHRLTSRVDRIEAAMKHNTGDGQRMIWDIGGKRGKFSVLFFGPHQHPYSNACCLLLRRPQVMNVNLFGERFCNESLVAAGGGYQWMSGNALNNQKEKTQYSIIDHANLREMIDHPAFYSAVEFTLALNDYESEAFVNRSGNCAAGRDNSMRQDWLEKLESDLHSEAAAGRVIIAETVEELAAGIGCDYETLQATIDTYNQACSYGYDGEFAKKAEYLRPVATPPYYAVKAWQGIDSIIGGITVDHRLRVIDTNDDPIPGLYSAGIGASGFLGSSYGFPGSESSYSMTTGYIAGGEIAEFLKKS